MQRAVARDLSSSGLPAGTVVENLAALKALTSRPGLVETKGQASAFDGLGAAYGWHLAATDTVNEPFIVSPTSGAAGRYKMVAPFQQSGTGAILRTMREKLREVELSVEDFWLAIDADDTNAINRAIAAVPSTGGTVIFNRTATAYNISAAIAVARSHIAFKAKLPGVVTINSTSTTANHFTIGAVASAYRVNIHFEGLVFTRTSICSAGWVIDATNVGYSNFRDLRVYGDNKQYQGLRFRSCNTLLFENILTESIQREHAHLFGLSSTTAGVDGNIINVVVNDWYMAGAHAASSSLATQGAFVIDDFAAGIWINMLGTDSHKGYALYLKGTLANIAYNTLIYVDEINVEGGLASSGAVRVDNFSNVYLNGDWISGRDLDTVYIGTNASGVHVTMGTIAIAWVASEMAAIYCDGQSIEITASELIGYSTSAHGTGLSLGTNANHINMVGGSIYQLAYGLAAVTYTGGKVFNFTGVRFRGNGANANFNLSGAHDLQIVGCNGVDNYLRGEVYLAGSAITAAMQAVASASNVNRSVFYGGGTGTAPTRRAIGSDPNVGITDQTQGTGNHTFKNGSRDNLTLLGAALAADGDTVMYLTVRRGATESHVAVTLAADVGGFRALRVAT